MNQVNVHVLQERVRVLEREIRSMKVDVKEQGEDLDNLLTSKETMLIKLSNIEKSLESIQTTVNKDSGWRGFFLDFIKAAAQIAVLVGAGKWIF